MDFAFQVSRDLFGVFRGLEGRLVAAPKVPPVYRNPVDPSRAKIFLVSEGLGDFRFLFGVICQQNVCFAKEICAGRGIPRLFALRGPREAVWAEFRASFLFWHRETITPAGRGAVRRGIGRRGGPSLGPMGHVDGTRRFQIPSLAFTCSTASTMLRSLAKATSQVRVRRPQSGAT